MLNILWTGEQKSWKIEFFVNFNQFFGISLVLAININDIFAATDTTIDLKILPIDICMQKFFKSANFRHQIRHNEKILGGFKSISVYGKSFD